jgi:putative membrane protein
MRDEELDTSTRLAFERTAMAADRSLMAWIRTAIALVAFGFTIDRVIVPLEAVRAREGVPILGTPRAVGIFLIALGSAAVGVGLVDHHRVVQRLRRGSGVRSSWLVALVAFFVGALGAFLLVDLLLRSGLP